MKETPQRALKRVGSSFEEGGLGYTCVLGQQGEFGARYCRTEADAPEKNRRHRLLFSYATTLTWPIAGQRNVAMLRTI